MSIENPTAVVSDASAHEEATAPQHRLLAGYLERLEAAREFKVSARTVSEWIDRPDGLPHLRLGKRIYIPVAAAREWIAKRIRQRNPSKLQRIRPR